MKLRFETVIDASQESVWAAFDNPDNLKRWQQNLVRIEPVSGEPGQPGCVCRLVYDEKGKEVVLTETVTERRQPSFMAGTYESDSSGTLIVNHFEKIDEDTTRWTSWCNFTLRGWMRLFGLFIASAVRKRTEADMARFKLMVETDLANAS